MRTTKKQQQARSEVYDLVGWAMADSRKFHQRELTAEFTVDDVRRSIKSLLRELLDREPTDEDADEVLNY